MSFTFGRATALGATDPFVFFCGAESGLVFLGFNLSLALPLTFTGFAADFAGLAAGFAALADLVIGFARVFAGFDFTDFTAGFAAFFTALAGAGFFDFAAGFAGLALAI
ncbi:MAG: hypothetical protein K8R23_14275 [Chthoniobacter sp.]|nr:hypothetical protein [Chthoniobacter sp.]